MSLLGGLLGGSKSSATTATNYTSTDKRNVADNGSMSISGDRNVINTTDNGAVQAALHFAENADAVQGQGMQNLIQMAGTFFDQSRQAVTHAADMTAQAYQQAADSKTIDNRTIAVIAIAAAVGLAFWAKK